MFSYPKKLNRKELKKISKYSCDEEIKDAYLKYLTNYSFKEFVKYCEDNNDKNLEELLFSFTDLQLEKFEPNSLIWISHALINFLIYSEVNLDYNEYYDAYASLLQFTVLNSAMDMMINKISFDAVEIPEQVKDGFEKLFAKNPEFRFNLEKDCELAYKSFNNDFNFTIEEFYLKIKEVFYEYGYEK